MENHIYASSYSPSTNYRSFRDPPADTMFLSHHLHHHRTDASSAAALRFPSSALSAVEAADIAPPGVTSRIASSSAAAAAANFLSTWPPAAAAAPSALDLKRSSEGQFLLTFSSLLGYLVWVICCCLLKLKNEVTKISLIPLIMSYL